MNTEGPKTDTDGARAGGVAAAGGSVVVDDVVYIPDGPGDDETARAPCEITSSLRSVYYGGANIGTRWRIAVAVNGWTWDPGPVNLAWQTWNSFGRAAHTDRIEFGCGVLHPLAVSATAQNLTPLLPAQPHTRTDAMITHCLPEGLNQELLLTVPVPQCGARWRGAFGKPVKPAILTFLFAFSARCA